MQSSSISSFLRSRRQFPWAAAGLAAGAAWAPALAPAASTYTLAKSINAGAASWSQGSTFAGGAVAAGTDNTADFGKNLLAGALSLTLDGNETIGNLSFGDQGGVYNASLSAGTGGVLTLAVSSGAPVITVANDGATISATLAGTSGLTKAGSGNLVLTGVNSLQGTITVGAGTLTLDYSQGAGAAGASILQSTSPLVLAGGTLNVTGSTGVAVSQSFAGLTLNTGASSLVLTSAADSSPVLVSLGAISRNAGGTINFTEPSGVLGTTNGITTSSGNIIGIIGGWATVGGTDWAASSGGQIVPVASYTSTTTAGTTLSNYVAANTDVTSSLTLSGLSTNSLRFNTALADILTLTGTNVVSSGGILVTAAVGNKLSKITGGSLQGASGADLVVIQNNTANGLTIGSTIIDNTSATGLTKSGAGLLTLTAANTYTGTTFVNGGTLALGIANAIGSSSNVVVDGGAFSLVTFADAVASLTLQSGSITGTTGALTSAGGFGLQSGAVSAVLGGTTALTKSTAGTVLLSGANTYTGTTTIATGDLQASNINATATTAQSLGKSATAIILGGGTSRGTLEYTGTAAVTLSRPLTLSGAGGIVENSSASRLTLSGAIAPGGEPLTLSGGALTVSGVIGDSTANTASSFEVNGAQVTLSAVATYGGATTVDGGGVLFAGVANALPAATTITLGESVNNTGGSLDLNNFALTITGLASAGSGSAIVTNSGSAVKVLSITGTSTFGGTLQDGAGGLNLAKTTAGTLTLTGVSTYTGGTFVKNGAIVLAGGVDNRLIPNGTIILGNGTTSTARLQLGDASGPSSQSFSSLTVTAGTTGVSSIVGGNTAASTLTLNISASDLYPGNLGGTGTNYNLLTLIKTGAGTLTLSGKDTYAGGTSIVLGTLALGSATALPSAGAVAVSGGILDLGGFTDSAGAVSLASGSIVNSGATATLNAASYAVQSGSISASLGGAGALTKSGTNSVVLSGANAYAGGTFVNQGTLVLGSANALPASGALTVQGGALDLGGNSSAAGVVTLSGGSIVNTGADAVLTGSSYNLSSGSVGVALSGAGSSLVKSGAGTVILSGVNTYTGSTSITGGLLSLNAASSGGGAITVADGSALAVNLTAAGQTLTVPSLSLGSAAGGALDLGLGIFGNPTAPIVAAGLLTVNGASTINISGGGLTVGTFPLISYAGGLGGNGFSGLSLGTLPARITASLVNDTVDSLVQLQITGFDVPRWTGAHGGAWDIDDGTGTVGTLNFKLSGGSPTGYYQSSATGTDSVIFDDSATGTTNVQLTTTLTPNSVTVSNSVLNYVFSGSGKLSGTASLTKSGSGKLALVNTGSNDYTGVTTISGGIFQAGDGQTAGAGQLGAGNIALTGGTLALDRPLGDDVLLGNAISGDGTLLQEGGNAVTISRANSAFTGNFIVQAGVLRLGNNSSLGSASGAVQAGATLDLASYSPANPLVFSGGTLKTAASASDTLSGNVTLSGNPTLSIPTGGSLTISGTVTGSAGFTKSDVGSLVLLGGNSYTGVTAVNAGTLQVGNATALGSAADGTTVQAGAVLDVAGYAIAEPIILNGGALRSSTGTAGGDSGGVNLSARGTVDVAAGAFLSLSGAVSGSGGLSKSSGGTLSLGGSSAFTGGLTINGGTVLFTTSGSLPTSGAVTLASGTAAAFGFGLTQAQLALVTPTTNAVTIGLAADDGNDLNLANYSAASLGSTSQALYSGNLTPSTGGYLLGGGGGTLTVSSLLSGSNALTIGSTGTGTVVLTAGNTFSGAIKISAGTLKLGQAQALGAAGNALAVSGTLDLNGFSVTAGALTGTGAITDSSAVPGVTTFTENIATGTTTYTGGINDGVNGRVLAFVKDGSGTLVLNAPNGSNYSGGTSIHSGTLDVRTNNAQVLPGFSNLTFTGTGTLLATNNGTGAGSLVLGNLTFQGGDGTVTSVKLSSGTSQTLAFNNAPTRLPGATGNFTLLTATDPSLYKVLLINPPSVTGQSLDGGIYYGGNSFAAYDTVGSYIRPLNYATDANAAAVAGGQATLGAVTGKDVQLTAGTGDISAELADTVRTLSLPGAGNLTLDSVSGAILTISAGGLLKSGGNAATISGGAGLTTGGAGDLVVRTDQAADQLTIATSILASTTGGLTKTGSGTLVLSGTNAYGGSTWVNAGVLRANDGSGLGAGALILNGGVFETGANLNRGLGSGSGQVQVLGASGFGAFAGNETFDFSGSGQGSAYSLVWGGSNFNPTALTLNLAADANTLTLANSLNLNGAARSIVVNAGVANLAAPVTGPLGSSLTKSGAGTLLISGATAISGGITVSAGVLRLGGAGVLGVATPLTINGATLDLNGYSATLGALSANSTGTVTDNSSGAGVTTLTEYVTTGTPTFTGTLSDGASKTLAVVKDGPGTWILNKAGGSIYSGGTTINQGILDVRTNNANVLKSGDNVSFSGSGIFRAANNGTAASSLTLGALAFNGGDGVFESNQMNTGATQTVTIAAAPTRLAGATGNFTLVTATDPSKFKVVFTAAPATGSSINGGLYYNGSNFAAYDSAGYVRALNYATDANASNVVLASDQPTLGVITGTDVQLSGTGNILAQTTDSVRSLKIAGTNSLTLDAASSATLTIAGGGLLKAGGGAAVISGGSGLTTGGSGDLVVRADSATDTLTISTPILATTTGGLTKSGLGVVTLAAAESYTGVTTVNAGTLVVSGSISGSTIVQAGATLTGTGALGPVAVESGGTLAAASQGGQTGALSISTLTLQGGSTLALTLGAGAGNPVSSTSSFWLGGVVNLSLTLTGAPVSGSAFSIDALGSAGYNSGGRFAWQGTILNDGDTFSATSGGFTQQFQISYGSTGSAGAELLAVPEPGALPALTLGAALLLGSIRRRRQARN